jgi:hypothetical protein
MAVEDMASAPPSHRHRNRKQHLGQAQSEDFAAHGHQLGQRKLQSDGEHQKHHAKLGKLMGCAAFVSQAQAMRPDEYADHQIAQHGRQMQHAKDHHAQNGRGK